MNRLRVLVVEDEVAVAMLIEDMLEELGHAVVGPLASVEQALAAIEREGADCAILDVNLRGVPAYPIADALRARGIPYAFSTGYGAAALRKEDLDSPVLQKPFRSSDLAGVIAGFGA